MSSLHPAPHHAQDHFQLFADSVMDYAFHTLDATGHVATWNRGAERLFGYSSEEILGDSFECFYSQEAKDRKDPERDLAMAEARGSFEIEGWRI